MYIYKLGVVGYGGKVKILRGDAAQLVRIMGGLELRRKGIEMEVLGSLFTFHTFVVLLVIFE